MAVTRRALFSLAVALCGALCCVAAEERGRFLVLTDVHIADDYVVGSAPKTFCTAGTGKAGEHGYYNCDTPMDTFASSLRFAQSVGPYEFVLWLGDSPTKYLEHPQHNQTTAHVMENVRRVADTIAAAFPDTPVFPNLGNHDHNPDDALAPNETAYLDAVAKLWARWLPADVLETVRRGGYYSAPVRGTPGLRVVSLNTLYWSATNAWTANLTGDIGGQFAWLKQVFAQARAAREHVLVVGHVPPVFEVAINQWRPDFYDRYAALLAQYTDTVVGHIFGHMHQDVFSVIAPPAHSSLLLSPAMVVPGVTPRSSNMAPDSGPMPGKNPAIRVYDYSPSQLLDYTQYYADLAAANAEHRPLEWRRDYTFRAEYGLPDLSAQSFHTLAKRVAENQDDWCKFYTHLFVRNLRAPQAYANLVRRAVVCSNLYTTLTEYLSCTTSKLPTFVCDFNSTKQ